MAEQTLTLVDRVDNRVIVKGQLGLADLHRLLATIHTAVEKRGYSHLVFDFSECTAALPPPMVAVCAQVMRIRAAGASTEVILPTKDSLTRLFRNTNWAYILDPERQRRSTFQGYTQVPATNFTNPAEQASAVNAIVNVLLAALSGVSRADFAAIEWSLAELTDNVLTHAQAVEGGLVQVSTFERKSRRVEFVVADAGVGIPATLREAHTEITSDTQALERAIREGITRDKIVGQGNGLYGSFQVCRVSEGYFGIHSGYATLNYDHTRALLRVRQEAIPFNGTLVVAGINCSKPGLLEDALKFGGEVHRPVDTIELKYQSQEGEAVEFVLAEESPSFGSRLAGDAVRRKLANLSAMCPGKKVRVDFSNVPLVSSSFADEVFGKLFIEFGAVRFMQLIQFMNVNETVRRIIDRAIAQRIAG